MKKRWLSVILVLAMLTTLFPVTAMAGNEGETDDPTYTIYVSSTGLEGNDGLSQDTPTTLSKATAIANSNNTPVKIAIIGDVDVDTWTSPTVATTIYGINKDATLKFAYCSASSGKYNISLAGPLTIDDIQLDCIYSLQGSRYYGTYTIVANGNKLVIGKNTEYVYYTSTLINGIRYETTFCHIIGGGLNENITGGTHVEIYASLPCTYVYGGGYNSTVNGDVYLKFDGCGKVQHLRAGGYSNGKDATVTGDITLDFCNSVADNAIYGGGYAANSNASTNASVIGDIHINLSKLGKGFGKPIYGGGYGEKAPVTGDITITASNVDMRNNSAAIYGGGNGGDVTGDVKIQITDSTIASETVWGGGNAADVNGSVTISLSNCSEAFGEIYGGGNGGNVTGTVDITLAGGQDTACPDIFATGKGKTSDRANINDDVTVTLNGSRANVYTMGKNGSITNGNVTVTLKDDGTLTGAVRGDENKTQYLYNYEKGNESNTVSNTKVIVTGDYVSTGIIGFSEIEIRDGGTLREHLSDSGQTLFRDCGDLTIQNGGALDILQDNKVSGTASISGTLIMPRAAALTADGQVTVSDGALFAPTDGYAKGDVFLRSQTAFTQGSQPEFAVTETGEKDKYFTTNRKPYSDPSIQHEWYVDQLEFITITPMDITGYTGGDSMSDDSFPTVRYSIRVPEGVSIDLLDLQYNGKLCTLIESGYYYVIPELENTFTLIKGANPTGNSAENDQQAGLYSIGIAGSNTLTANEYGTEYAVTVADAGKLKVRHVSEPMEVVGENAKSITEPVVANEELVETSSGMAVAVIPDGATFYTNGSGSNLGVVGTGATGSNAQIALLFDDVLDLDASINSDADAIALLIDHAKQSNVAFSENQYEFKYLDLVNANDGNAWVSTDQDITIYWPYPEAVKSNPSNYTYQIVHFEGLHRENYADANNGVKSQIEQSRVSVFSAEATEQGVKFTLQGDEENGCFSPFALTWQQKGGTGGGGGGTTYYKLHYESNGGTEYPDESYASGTTVHLDKVPTREGYTFTGWYADADLTDAITEIKMTAEATVYAGWEVTEVPEWLNGDDHFAYVIGYEDGLVRPTANITRAEVATIFFRLLTDEMRNGNLTDVSPFDDVSADDWYNTAIATMAKLGILKGRTETTFEPNAPITRAEFAAICARFDTGLSNGDSNFTDIAGHWAEAEIERAVTLGWINGYEDNTFRPENAITRAEAMTMINRVLQRLPETADDLLAGMITWPDNPSSEWYYLAVQEATNSHDFDRKDDGVHEKWTALTTAPDWSIYE